MDKSESLCKVKTNNGEFYLHSAWPEDKTNGFHLNITNGSSIWTADVSKDNLQDMANQVEMNIDKYATQTFQALKADTEALDTFDYHVYFNDSSMEFIWKKSLDHGVKFQLGSIILRINEDGNAMMKTILDFSIRETNDYKAKIAKAYHEKELVSNERDGAFAFLEECVAKKEKIELDLYQKFVTVLNDKKAKIRQLQDTIEQQLTTQNDLKKKSYEGENAEIAKNEHGTDEKDNEDNVKNKESQQNETMSLFQDTDDQTAPVKKRRQKRSSRVPVKKTPSKSFIPEVKMRVECSNTSDASTASNESLQYNSHKTTRTRKNKVPPSTFTEDIDELFGNMM